MATLTKDTNFNMRMNRQKKSDLEALYSRLGMTLPEAVNIFSRIRFLSEEFLLMFVCPVLIGKQKQPFRRLATLCPARQMPNLTALPGNCSTIWMLNNAYT